MYKILVSTAERANELLKGKPENWTGVATQLVQEKGWEWWTNPQPPYNIGNNFDVHGKLRVFPNLEAGIEGYVFALTYDPAGYYTHVRDAIENGTAEQFLEALSKSPYCNPPYPIAELEAVHKLVMERFVPQQLEPAAPAQPPTVAPIQNSVPDVQLSHNPEPQHPTHYRIQPGDTLEHIAQIHELTLEQLQQFNPQIHNPNFILVGQEIRVG